MIKHYCDWCGKEMGDSPSKSWLAEHTMLLPNLMQRRWCGEPIGKPYISGKRKKYIVCDECTEKIWRLRHDCSGA